MHTVRREFVHAEETHRWYHKGEEPRGEEEKEGIIDTLKDLV